MSPDPVDLLRLAASRLDGRQNTKHSRHPHVIRNTLFPQALLWDCATDIFSILNHLSSLPVCLACLVAKIECRKSKPLAAVPARSKLCSTLRPEESHGRSTPNQGT